MTAEDFEAALQAIRKSAARARESVDRSLADLTIRKAGTLAREEAVRRATAAEWRSWTLVQRSAVAELFSGACRPHGCFVLPPDSQS